MLKLDSTKSILKGELKLSDCEHPFVVRWLSGSSQASFFIGDLDSLKDDIANFISGKKECYIEIDRYVDYLKRIKLISNKYKSLYYGPLDYIDGLIDKYSTINPSDAKIILKYERYKESNRYIRILNDKSDKGINEPLFGIEALKNGRDFRNSFIGGITKIKIIKKDETYRITIDLVDNWRDIIMQESGKKVDLDSIISVFNVEIDNLIREGKTAEEAAQIFGVRYAPLLANNSDKFTANEIVNGSSYNSENVKVAVINGMSISSSIIWEINKTAEDSTDMDSHNVIDNIPLNIIYYGTPGCGKSYYVDKSLSRIDKNLKIRTTFYPDYSYSDFIGQILPIVEKYNDDKGEEKERIKYDFIEGPFFKALKVAKENPDKMVYLIIEEINRGNAASIFGDTFQLLDRNDDDPSSPEYMSSRYEIFNSLIQDKLEIDKVKIPANLSLIATMNTSDQNVFALDTAFKRRWKFQMISNEFNDPLIGAHKYADYLIPGTNIKWQRFVERLNEEIVKYQSKNSSLEDKRIGKYFVNKDLLVIPGSSLSFDEMDKKCNDFAYKVLEYIWDDVAKFKREEWFNTNEYSSLELLIKGFKEKNLEVFKSILF